MWRKTKWGLQETLWHRAPRRVSPALSVHKLYEVTIEVLHGSQPASAFALKAKKAACLLGLPILRGSHIFGVHIFAESVLVQAVKQSVTFLSLCLGISNTDNSSLLKLGISQMVNRGVRCDTHLLGLQLSNCILMWA
jgi:hypothetical protein